MSSNALPTVAQPSAPEVPRAMHVCVDGVDSVFRSVGPTPYLCDTRCRGGLRSPPWLSWAMATSSRPWGSPSRTGLNGPRPFAPSHYMVSWLQVWLPGVSKLPRGDPWNWPHAILVLKGAKRIPGQSSRRKVACGLGRAPGAASLHRAF